MSKKVLETIIINGVIVNICSNESDYFVEYNNISKPINPNTYFMFDVYKDLDPKFSYLEYKDLHGEEFTSKERDLYNFYKKKKKRLRYIE